MKITPLDIQKKKFRVKLRGFDNEEVTAFLDVVQEEMEGIVIENATMKEELRRTEMKLKEYRDLEETMKTVLITAQKMVDEHKGSAQREAEIILKEARLKAHEIVREAEKRIIKLHEDISELKSIKRHFKEEVLRLIEGHKKMLPLDDKD
ncbi:MAG TPA: DivIVA domain-containing protein [Thermodesulfovibrionia bacterium]|nr:DivIVA domain-containing protein [Thermodesulfovibrionia bacterium]